MHSYIQILHSYTQPLQSYSHKYASIIMPFQSCSIFVYLEASDDDEALMEVKVKEIPISDNTWHPASPGHHRWGSGVPLAAEEQPALPEERDENMEHEENMEGAEQTMCSSVIQID